MVEQVENQKKFGVMGYGLGLCDVMRRRRMMSLHQLPGSVECHLACFLVQIGADASEDMSAEWRFFEEGLRMRDALTVTKNVQLLLPQDGR